MDTENYRLPTALIIPLIQLFVVGFLFMAILNDQLDLTVLGLVVVVVMAGTRVWSRLSPVKLRCESSLDKQRVFAGESLVLSTRIQNAKVLPVLVQVKTAFASCFQPAEDIASPDKDGSLLWYQQADFQWRLTALRRGVYQLGPAQLSVGDLFGFYTRQVIKPGACSVIVYPRLVPLKPLALPRRDFFGIPGAKSPIEDPVFVYGTREYQSGRPARYIHWKASARFGQLQEKICEPAAQEKILLLVDVARFAECGAHAEFEKILEAAASAAVGFDRAGFALGLVTNGALDGGGPNVLPIGRGPRQMPKILETLARLQMTPLADLAGILKQGLKLPWGTTGFSLGYEPGRPADETAAFFKNRRAPLVSVVCRRSDPSGDDQKLTSSGVLTLEDLCIKDPA
jgi:uncharacterized protein (DUF58 family)